MKHANLHCPVCKDTALHKVTVEARLSMMCCKACDGRWLSSTAYWSWLGTGKQASPEKPWTEIQYHTTDSQVPKICPDCGRILIRFRVGHDLDFCLDHCNHCNGVWFDSNEWDVLKSKNLHTEVHKIFTTEWQREIKQAVKAQYFEASYRTKFGESYARIKEFKEWLDRQKERQTILAYLADPEPYE